MSDLEGTSGQITELVDLAGRFREGGRLDEAADLLLLALRLDPKNMSVKLSLAEVRKLQQQHGGGARSLRDVLREGLRRNAIDAAHFLGLAHLYAEKGENARAIECLEVAKAKDLANPASHKLHGRILFRRRDFDGAAEELGKALRLNPFDREIAEQLGRTEFERKRFEAALGTTVHAFLLLNDGDEEGIRRLRRRIQTLKQLLGWGNRELTAMFRERQELVHTAFERLEWHRERILEQGNASTILLTTPPGPAERRAAGGLIDLASRMRRLKPWGHFSDEQIFRLTGIVREEVHDAGSLIFGHKSRGRDLFVLERGEITIQRPTPYGTFTLGTLAAGDLFGEVSFITAHERSSDALATKASHLLRINADSLLPLVESSADLGVQLYWALWHGLARKLRGTNEQLRSFFASEPSSESFVSLRRKAVSTATAVRVAPSDKIKLFREQGISRRELTTFAAFAREKRFPSGAFLFQEGDEGDEMYIVLEGRVIISKLIQGAGEEALAILERGDFFGEMSLIDGEPRSADARAYGGPLTVLALDQATVREILAMDPHAALEFLQLLCRLVANRLREIDDKVLGWRILSGERNERVSA
jgi:CRP-like cAMP-binding protein/Flp pilus assembly protein TadD